MHSVSMHLREQHVLPARSLASVVSRLYRYRPSESASQLLIRTRERVLIKFVQVSKEISRRFLLLVCSDADANTAVYY